MEMPANNTAETVTDDPCTHDPDMPDLKVYSVSIGTILAIAGIFSNVYILRVFARAQYSWTTNTRLLATLAFFDLVVLTCYLILYALKTYAEFTENPVAYSVWVNSAPVVFPISKMAKMCTTYVMVCSAIERLCNSLTVKVGVAFSTTATMRVFRMFEQRTIPLLIISIFTFCFLSHVLRFWEIVVHFDERCSIHQFGRYSLKPANSSKFYQEVYGTWYTNITNVIIPFIALLCLSVINVIQYRRKFGTRQKEFLQMMMLRGSMGNKSFNSYSSLRKQLKESTQVSIVLVFTHIILNTLGFVLLILETQIMPWLIQHLFMYNIFVEIINISAVLNSSIRLCNYLYFNSLFRRHAQQIWYCGEAPHPGSFHRKGIRRRKPTQQTTIFANNEAETPCLNKLSEANEDSDNSNESFRSANQKNGTRDTDSPKCNGKNTLVVMYNDTTIVIQQPQEDSTT